NKSDQEKIQQKLQEQAEQQQAREAMEAEKSLVIDSISPAELAGIPAIMRQAGTSAAQTDGNANNEFPITYSNKNVALSYDGETVTGTVAAADTTLTFEAVAKSQFGDDLSPENRRTAIANLRSALSEADRYGGFARHLNGQEQLVTLKNDLLSLDISTHGGNIARATLLDYFNYLPKPGTNDFDTTRVDVWQLNKTAYNFILTSATQRFDTGNFYFTPEVVNDSTVMMKLDLGKGASWALRYTLPKGSYVVKMDVVQQRMETVIPPSVATVELQWHQTMGRNEQGRTFEERNSGIYYKYVGDTPDDIASQGDHSETLKQRLKWIAFKNQFFSSVMIPRTHFVAAEVESKDLKNDPSFVKDLTAKTTMDYNSTAGTPLSVDIFI
ncbi:MAG: YidC/Oxa1 family insertase periplasmic-domain containing protein, partial [Muribaculaceae bacterium]|nr:YidC/Oxa1 family insertase periplasmic-domain containing protein [Muribaculaceae bacterium]